MQASGEAAAHYVQACMGSHASQLASQQPNLLLLSRCTSPCANRRRVHIRQLSPRMDPGQNCGVDRCALSLPLAQALAFSFSFALPVSFTSPFPLPFPIAFSLPLSSPPFACPGALPIPTGMGPVRLQRRWCVGWRAHGPKGLRPGACRDWQHLHLSGLYAAGCFTRFALHAAQSKHTMLSSPSTPSTHQPSPLLTPPHPLQHGRNAIPRNLMWHCYTVGGTKCARATASSIRGAAWVQCDPKAPASSTGAAPAPVTVVPPPASPPPAAPSPPPTVIPPITVTVKDPQPGADPRCACSEDGVSGGVPTNRKGCKQHGRNAFPRNLMWHCYTVGGTSCPIATPSSIQGAAWRECSPNS